MYCVKVLQYQACLKQVTVSNKLCKEDKEFEKYIFGVLSKKFRSKIDFPVNFYF